MRVGRLVTRDEMVVVRWMTPEEGCMRWVAESSVGDAFRV